MIYAVIVNELGLAGAAALLGVYLMLVARGLKTAVLARDSFSKLLATGLSFILALQVNFSKPPNPYPNQRLRWRDQAAATMGSLPRAPLS